MNIIRGYASHFLNIDDVSDIMMPGSIQNLNEFLSTGFVAGLEHDWDNPIGSPIYADINEKGLFVELQLNDTPQAKQALDLIKRREIKYFSIGFRTMESRYIKQKEILSTWESYKYNPLDIEYKSLRDGDLLVRCLDSIQLFEVSPVKNPANKKCSITSFSENGNTQYFESW